MPITPYLIDQHSFAPEQLKAMSEAFTEVCNTLGLVDRDDPATRLVASRIIEHAEGGVRGRDALYQLVLNEYQQTPRWNSASRNGLDDSLVE